MNFCVEGLGTTISVNQVEAEGHSCQNLITKNVSNLRSGAGFMADSFVRPPVTVSLKFPVSIEVSHIVISPKVGRQSSSGFIIHTKTSSTAKYLVAREFMNGPIPDAVVFRNPRFVLRHPLTPTELYSRHKNHDVMFNLKHPSFNACERVVALDITISRVANSTVPALGGVQVWGQPSPGQGEKLYKIWSEIVWKPTAQEKEEQPSPVKRAKLSPDSFPIPDDFLDGITYEIMVQPIRLPCGLAVDARTLEKYYEEESKFGRLPNDPFTGATFTETLKPVVDAALKGRIDAFCTRNADHEQIRNLPRTLGASSKRHNLAATTAPDRVDKCSVVVSTSSDGLTPEQQLDHELTKALSTGSPFYSPKMAAKFQCHDCNQSKSDLPFYRGLCEHIILCRNCLTKTDKRTHKNCSRCGVQWRADDCRRLFI